MQNRKSPHPEWALKFRKPGTELRCINGRYCLYECHSVYEKETKKHRKITGKYLGSITEEGGFKPSRKRQLEAELEKLRSGEAVPVKEPKVGEDKEYGLSYVVNESMGEINERLKKDFPADYSRIVALAYCRLRSQSSMRDVLEDFSDSYISTKTGTAGLAPSQLTSFLSELGGKRAEIVGYMNYFCSGSSNIIFDGTDLISASRKMGLAKMTKTKTGAFDNALNMMMVYSLDRKLPSYYRILPGDIKDVKAFKICMDESGASSACAIIDKTFPSRENLEFLESSGIKYIAAVRRTTKGLDYSVFRDYENGDLDGFFCYHDRLIWHKELNIDGRRVIMFKNEEHAAEERKDYLDRVQSGKFKAYTMENYKKKASQFGSISIVTNTDKTPQQTYEAYKTRCEVEQAIDAFKTNLDADSSHMQSAKAFEAYTFINFVALQWYYVIREKLRAAGKLTKYSPMQLVKHLSHIRAVFINGKWTRAEMTKKQVKLLNELGWQIT